jgi:hypothetical protein
MGICLDLERVMIAIDLAMTSFFDTQAKSAK